MQIASAGKCDKLIIMSKWAAGDENDGGGVLSDQRILYFRELVTRHSSPLNSKLIAKSRSR